MTPTAQHVRRWLAELPELAALLPAAAITRGAIDGPRPAPASKPPVKVHVLDLLDTREKWDWRDGMDLVDPDRQGILPYLDGWVRDLESAALDGDDWLLIDPMDPPPPPSPEAPTVAGCCNWLAGILDWAERLPQWPEFADGIRQMHGRVRAATRLVDDVEPVPVPCQRCGAGALERIPGTDPKWECDACGNFVTMQAVTINQAAKIIDVPKDRLYALVNRPALLREAGVEAPRRVLGESGGRKLYDLGDLRRLVAEIRVREGA